MLFYSKLTSLPQYMIWWDQGKRRELTNVQKVNTVVVKFWKKKTRRCLNAAHLLHEL